MSIIFSSVTVGGPRKYGEAQRAYLANEPCCKGCGRRPNGRTRNSWKVHESTCNGKPPKRQRDPNRLAGKGKPS